MKLNTWWYDDPEERYWMEITDRVELGRDLLAPQSDGAGRPNWTYQLVTETRPGDVVFHWHRTRIGEPAIVGWSTVTGPLGSGTITWQARGTRGRQRGVATTSPSWVMECAGLVVLEEPVRLRELNRRVEVVRDTYRELEERYTSPFYLPFIFYRPTELRATQGYLTKFPRRLVERIGELAAVAADASPVVHQQEPMIGERSRDTGRSTDSALNKAVERHAVNAAIEHYRELGATQIEERGKPFDLLVRGLGSDRHVEVKGSTSSAIAVELTTNEVAHAANYQPTDLVVVDGIRLERTGNGSYAASEGRLTKYSDWRPALDALSATKYRYELPTDDSGV